MLKYKIVGTGDFVAVEGCPPSNIQLFDDSEWLVNSVESNGDRISEIYVELEFEKPAKIETIEIGNAGSALVQVFVWDDSTSKYVVFMPTQIMSTPPECIANKNRNKLRFFTKFTAQQSQKLWKRVKIVCKNTFSKLGTPFGLASVRFNSPNDAATEKCSSAPSSVVSEMSSKQAELPIKKFQVPVKSGETSETCRLVLKTPELSTESKDVLNRGPGMVSHQAPSPSSLPNKKNFKKEETEETASKTFYFDDKIGEEEEGEEKPSTSKDGVLMFMKDVVLAISGIGNPERSKLRSIVIEHGGKYTNDIDKSTTHLVCVSNDTDKYKEMEKKGGFIVTKKWVYDSNECSFKLPEGDYRLYYDDDDSDDDKEKSANMEKQKKKVPKSVSTEKPAKKKKKKGGNGDYDSEYESSGPDQYDMDDGFLVGDDEDDEDGSFVPSSSDSSYSSSDGYDDIEETIRESRNYIKKGIYSSEQKGHHHHHKKKHHHHHHHHHHHKSKYSTSSSSSSSSSPSPSPPKKVHKIEDVKQTLYNDDDDDDDNEESGYKTDVMSEEEMISRLSEVVQKTVATKVSKEWKELTRNKKDNNKEIGNNKKDNLNKMIIRDLDNSNKTITYDDDDLNKTIIFDDDDAKINSFKDKAINIKTKVNDDNKIFKGIHALVLIQEDEKKAEMVKSTITKNGGVIEEELGDNNKVTHIVVDTYTWDILFDDCLEVAKDVSFVHYDWILKCADSNTLIAIDPYVPEKK